MSTRVTNRFIAPSKKVSAGTVKNDLSIVILSAGNTIDKRFKRAIGLIEFNNGIRLIDYQITTLAALYPMGEIIVVVGYDADNIIKYIRKKFPDVRIVENENYEITNNVRSLGLALVVQHNPNLLVINGDLFFNKTTIENMAIGNSKILIDRKRQIGDEEAGATIINGLATYISHGLDIKWGQIAFLNKRELEYVTSAAIDRNNSKKYVYELLNESMEKECAYETMENKGIIKEFDCIKDLEYFNANISTI